MELKRRDSHLPGSTVLSTLAIQLLHLPLLGLAVPDRPSRSFQGSL